MIAAGDSYNDTAMLQEAHAASCSIAPDNVIPSSPVPVEREYRGLHGPDPRRRPASDPSPAPAPPGVPTTHAPRTLLYPDRLLPRPHRDHRQRVSGFIAEHRGWILETALAEPPADDEGAGRYFMRIEIKADSCPSCSRRVPRTVSARRRRTRDGLEDHRLGGQEAGRGPVSKQEHCLYDLLARWQAKELDIEIPCVISNHDTFRGFVEWHGIPFHHVPVTPDNKPQAYAEVQRLFEEVRGDTMVLARYMQILSPELCAAHPGQDHQHPPQLPAQLRRRQAHHQAYQGRQADRRHLPLRDRRTSTRARSSSRT